MSGRARGGISHQAMTEPSARLTHAKGREKVLGHLAMALFATLIGGSFSIGGIVAPHLGAAALGAVRFVIGTAAMAGAAPFLFRRGIARPEAPWRFLVLGGLMAIYFVTMFLALKITRPVSTSAVFTLIPLMSAGFGLLILGQRPPGVVLLSLVIAALGSLWVIFRGDVHALLAFDVGRGEMIFFAGCVCHAAYAPLIRRLHRGEPIFVFTLFTTGATALWLTLFGMGEILSTRWAGLPPIVWLGILYLAIVTSAGTFFLIQFASVRLPAAKVLAYGYLTPCVIIVIEGLIGHGWATPQVMAGALVTVGGLVILAFSPDTVARPVQD
jgi:drug/metabolite transporter (DMT)-like permease